MTSQSGTMNTCSRYPPVNSREWPIAAELAYESNRLRLASATVCLLSRDCSVNHLNYRCDSEDHASSSRESHEQQSDTNNECGKGKPMNELHALPFDTSRGVCF